MSEQIPLSSIFALIGVVVGFVLSQLSDVIRGKKRKKMIIKALVNELKVINISLSKASKDKDNRLPFESHPLITDTYDSVKAEIASMLEPAKLAVVQKTYQQIKQFNEPKSAKAPRGFIAIPGDGFIYQHNIEETVQNIEESINALA
jgi:hypothetical protein